MFQRFVPALAALVLVGGAGGAAAQSDARLIPVQFGRGPGIAPNAYDRGYREGVRQGEFDARRALPFDVQRDQVFRDGNRGDEQRYGTADLNREDFRRGYADGYRASYVRMRSAQAPDSQRNERVFGTTRRAGSYEEPAYARGYSDGVKQGTSDGRGRDSYDPVGHRSYRNGDEGYYGAYGSRDAYRNNYRAGYREGYEEGYRSWTGRR